MAWRFGCPGPPRGVRKSTPAARVARIRPRDLGEGKASVKSLWNEFDVVMGIVVRVEMEVGGVGDEVSGKVENGVGQLVGRGEVEEAGRAPRGGGIRDVEGTGVLGEVAG